MTSIVSPPRPAHVATDVPSPVRRASSHSSVTTLNSIKNPKSSANQSSTPATSATPAMTETTPGGAKLTSPSNSQSSASASDFGGLPGTFPRDPHVALEHLNEKAEAVSSQSNADSGTILDAARGDLRHAVDVVSQFLPGTVVGSLGSVLSSGPAGADNTEGKPETGKAPSSKVTFDPRNVAVGGIASDFDPSSSKARAATFPAAGADLIPSVSTPTASVGTPGAQQSTTSSAARESDDLVRATAVPASKEKKDDDVQGLAAKQTQSSDLRKKAIGTAALGAGAGAIGGAAYTSHSASERETPSPLGKANPKGGDLASSATPVAPAGDAEKPVSGALGSNQSVDQTQEKLTAPSALDTRGRSGAQKALNHPQETGDLNSDEGRKKAIQAAALGAGIGTIGGATYAHAHQPSHTQMLQVQSPQADVSPTGTAQPHSSDNAKSTEVEGPSADGKLAEDQPAFVSYAPAPVITEDYKPDIPGEAAESGGRLPKDQPAFVSYAPAPVMDEDYAPDVSEDDNDVADAIPPTSAVRDEKTSPLADTQKSADQADPSNNAGAKKGLEGVALGAGTGALGGTALWHSRGNEKQEGDVGVAPAGYTDKNFRKQMSQVDKDTANARGTEIGSGAAGAGAGGGAAYAHSRGSDRDPFGAAGPTAAPQSQPQSQAWAESADTANTLGSKESSKNEQTGASDDSKVKEGAEGAALGAGAGGVGGLAYRYLSGDKERDAAPTSPPSGARGLGESADANKGAGVTPAEPHDPSSAFDAPKSAQDTTDAAASKEVNGKDEAKDLKDSSTDGDSKHKKGFWAATLGAGAGVLSGAAFHKSRRKSEDKSEEAKATSVTSQPQSRLAEKADDAAHQIGSKDSATLAGVEKPSREMDTRDALGIASTRAGAGAIGSAFVADKKPLYDNQQQQTTAEGSEKDATIRDINTIGGAASAEGGEQTKGSDQSKELAAGAVGGTAAGTGSRLAANALREDTRGFAPSQGTSKDAAKTQTQRPVKEAEGPAKHQTQKDKSAKMSEDRSRTSDHLEKPVAGAVGGIAAGVGAGFAAKSLTSDDKQGPTSASPLAQQYQAHPSIKAASNSPQRPGPVAHGAAAPHDKPKSGADSDFPLPSPNASSTEVATKTADIDGSGKFASSGATDSKDAEDSKGKGNLRIANTAAGVITAGGAGAGAGAGATAASSKRESDKPHDDGADHQKEKTDEGSRRSSSTQRKRFSRTNGDGTTGQGAHSSWAGNGNGNGHGKKEGFVKHLVEKVKDKLHHHEKTA